MATCWGDWYCEEDLEGILMGVEDGIVVVVVVVCVVGGAMAAAAAAFFFGAIVQNLKVVCVGRKEREIRGVIGKVWRLWLWIVNFGLELEGHEAWCDYYGDAASVYRGFCMGPEPRGSFHHSIALAL